MSAMFAMSVSEERTCFYGIIKSTVAMKLPVATSKIANGAVRLATAAQS